MSRLEITAPDKAQLVVEELYKTLERRMESSPPGLCPVDMTRAFIEMCQTQSCGKCTPCRVGLWQLKNLLTDVMNGTATLIPAVTQKFTRPSPKRNGRKSIYPR